MNVVAVVDYPDATSIPFFDSFQISYLIKDFSLVDQTNVHETKKSYQFYQINADRGVL
jgi:hypothetical protein